MSGGSGVVSLQTTMSLLGFFAATSNVPFTNVVVEGVRAGFLDVVVLPPQSSNRRESSSSKSWAMTGLDEVPLTASRAAAAAAAAAAVTQVSPMPSRSVGGARTSALLSPGSGATRAKPGGALDGSSLALAVTAGQQQQQQQHPLVANSIASARTIHAASSDSRQPIRLAIATHTHSCIAPLSALVHAGYFDLVPADLSPCSTAMATMAVSEDTINAVLGASTGGTAGMMCASPTDLVSAALLLVPCFVNPLDVLEAIENVGKSLAVATDARLPLAPVLDGTSSVGLVAECAAQLASHTTSTDPEVVAAVARSFARRSEAFAVVWAWLQRIEAQLRLLNVVTIVVETRKASALTKDKAVFAAAAAAAAAAGSDAANGGDSKAAATQQQQQKGLHYNVLLAGLHDKANILVGVKSLLLLLLDGALHGLAEASISPAADGSGGPWPQQAWSARALLDFATSTPTTFLSLSLRSSGGGVTGQPQQPSAVSVGTGVVVSGVQHIATKASLLAERLQERLAPPAVAPAPGARGAQAAGASGAAAGGSGSSTGPVCATVRSWRDGPQEPSDPAPAAPSAAAAAKPGVSLPSPTSAAAQPVSPLASVDGAGGSRPESGGEVRFLKALLATANAAAAETMAPPAGGVAPLHCSADRAIAFVSGLDRANHFAAMQQQHSRSTAAPAAAAGSIGDAAGSDPVLQRAIGSHHQPPSPSTPSRKGAAAGAASSPSSAGDEPLGASQRSSSSAASTPQPGPLTHGNAGADFGLIETKAVPSNVGGARPVTVHPLRAFPRGGPPMPAQPLRGELRLLTLHQPEARGIVSSASERAHGAELSFSAAGSGGAAAVFGVPVLFDASTDSLAHTLLSARRAKLPPAMLTAASEAIAVRPWELYCRMSFLRNGFIADVVPKNKDFAVHLLVTMKGFEANVFPKRHIGGAGSGAAIDIERASLLKHLTSAVKMAPTQAELLVSELKTAATLSFDGAFSVLCAGAQSEPFFHVVQKLSTTPASGAGAGATTATATSTTAATATGSGAEQRTTCLEERHINEFATRAIAQLASVPEARQSVVAKLLALSLQNFVMRKWLSNKDVLAEVAAFATRFTALPECTQLYAELRKRGTGH